MRDNLITLRIRQPCKYQKDILLLRRIEEGMLYVCLPCTTPVMRDLNAYLLFLFYKSLFLLRCYLKAA